MMAVAFRLATLVLVAGLSSFSYDATAQTYYQPPLSSYRPPAAYYTPRYQAPPPYYSQSQAGNVVGNLLGGFLRAGMVPQARAAWSTFDPVVVQCINGSGRVTVPVLVSRGILPNDPRLANLMQVCQIRIAQNAARAQQQAVLAQQRADQSRELASEQAALSARREAEARSEQRAQRTAEVQRAARAQAAERAALDNERIETASKAAREAADVAASESLAAQDQKRNALFIQFQTKTVTPHDRIAALLNYTTYGSEFGTATRFWARKDGSKSVYAEYQEGSALAEPVVTIREVDTAKIDASSFFVKGNDAGVTVLIQNKVFAECAACARADVQSRWIDFFTNSQK